MSTSFQRITTKYPGVFYIIGQAVTSGKSEKIYYIRYHKGGKLIEEKAGRQFQNNMTAAKAATMRTERINGQQPTNKERREAARLAKLAEAGKLTIARLWEKYKAAVPLKGIKTDESRYKKYIEPTFAEKEPHELVQLDFDRLRIQLLKSLKPQTVKHILTLILRIINYGKNHDLCPALPFKVKKPAVDNIKIEYLTRDQLSKLMVALDKDICQEVADIMRLALFVGLRRGELFRLQWDDVDFERNFIYIRSPKGGKSEKIPLNDLAHKVLKNHPHTESPFVFPGEEGQQRVTAQKVIRRIRAAAGLPKTFRPLHGLRHTYASMLASSGQVDMYTLQKLLTHKSPQMTQRYAHLHDDTMQRAAATVDGIMGDIQKKKTKKKAIA